MRTLKRRMAVATISLLLVVVVAPVVQAAADKHTDDNNALTLAIAGLIGAHNFALPLSFVPEPITSVIAEAVTYGTNIGLKYIKAPFFVPPSQAWYPNTSDGCSYEFNLPRTEYTYSNLFGIVSYYDADPKWGLLNEGNPDFPQVFHANSQVTVSVASLPYFKRSENKQSVKFPAGVHRLDWRAETKIDDFWDIALPPILFAAVRSAPIWAARLKNGKAVQRVVESTRFAVGQFAVTTGLGALLDVAPRTTVTHRIPKTFTVFDTKPPVIDSNPRALKFEATDFGGTLLKRKLPRMKKAITASDKCNRPYSVGNDAPVLLPIGTTRVKWTVSDRGPNPQGKRNTSSITQLVTVEDTQAPIMVAPPGRVLETKGSGIKANSVRLGVPRVVDLADPAPRVLRKGPSFFGVDKRSKVTWTTKDASGNKTRATQWITVKKKGTNRPPRIQDARASTLTSKPVDIVLRGSDPDFLDGRFDPLSFKITRRPQRGEFVSPLFPFFIEDYRTKPAGPFGEEFRLSGNRGGWIYDNYCRSGAPNRESDLPRDFVYQPRFVQVADDGTTFMIDYYWWCNPSNSELDQRISKWDRNGNYLGQISYGGTNDSFVIDKDGFIYTLTKQGGGSSSELFISKMRSDFDVNPSGGVQVAGWKFTHSSAPLINPEQFSYARVDSTRGLLYLNDRSRVFVFDVRDQRSGPRYLGTFNDGERIIGTSGCNYGSSWTGFAMEVDSKGNLYVADTCSGRIHKMNASRFDADGNFRMGRYVGWMGRCEGSTNKACDLTRKASRGYSCTDATCQVDRQARIGSGQGQFNSPVYLSIDPKDVLYVADTGNSRIQRFGPDGSFAGEAVSTGTGVNQGDRPSFVLGNMGRPKAVTVNSTKFFVVDVEEKFVHVFKTSPFKKITSNSVTVTYVSNFDFQGTDRFSFRSSDGLARSRAGVAEIKVKRNFRPPRSLVIVCYRPAAPSTRVACKVPEDGSILIKLKADDPDGIIGKDFLGLDALKYTIFKPTKGTLKLKSANAATALYLYRPKRDYNGRERIQFKVSDGRDTVTSKKFAVAVTPVNDSPIARKVSVQGAARGFPARLVARYLDIDRDATQNPPRMVIYWGDGTIEQQGEIVKRSNDEYEATGPLLTPGAPGQGYISGFHSYRTAGNKQVRICLTDGVDSTVRCVAEVIKVIEATNVTVAIKALDEEPLPGQGAFFEVEVTNQAPESWAGLNSEELEVIVAIPPSLKVRNAGPLCEVRAGGAELRCEVGVLAAGASRVFRIRLAVKAGIVPGPTQMLSAKLNNSGVDVSAQRMAAAAVSLQWPDTDGDGMPDAWERVQGLDPLVADADGDLDGDGASNLDEYLAVSDARDRRSTPSSPYRIDGVGIYELAKAIYRMRGRPSAGKPQLAFRFGKSGRQPLVGDWNGANGDSIGSYDENSGEFMLKNRNAKGKPNLRFRFGGPRKVALAGDWNGNGKTSIGIYDQVRRKFLLKDVNKAGKPDYTFSFGKKARFVPIVGDWNGDGRDSVGQFDPKSGRFLMRYSNDAGSIDRIVVLKGAVRKIPVVGDWNGDGIDNIGVYNEKTGIFLLRSRNTDGSPDIRFAFGPPGMAPLMGGDWNRLR